MTRLPRRRPGHPYLAGGPLLIAHRGGAKLAPENTLHAFRNAVDRWGADMLEMDVHATRDGEVVVIHDPTVDRTTDGSGAVKDLTWAEVRDMDAGYSFQNGGGGFPFRGVGARIPRFEEVLTAFPDLRLNVEAKDTRSAPLLVDIIFRHSAQDRVLVAAEWERNRRSVRGYPGPWGASRVQLTLFHFLLRTPLRSLYTPACEALQVPPVYKGKDVITPRFMAEAHGRNLPVHVWTVDEEDDMRRLLAKGVDGIQTDRPDRLARVLTEETGRPPPPAWREEGSPPSEGETP